MKYKILGAIVFYISFVTWVATETGNPPVQNIDPDFVKPTGILAMWESIKSFVETFWKILVFKMDGVPYIISLSFVVCSFIIAYMIVNLVRGTD